MVEHHCEKGWAYQSWLFHAGNALILVGLVLSWARLGRCINVGAVGSRLATSALISLGLLCLSLWGWLYLCALDVAIYNLILTILYAYSVHKRLWSQYLHHTFPWKVEQVYQNVFQPRGITRAQFKKLFDMSSGIETMMPRRVYVLTEPKKVRLLISGSVTCTYGNDTPSYTVMQNEFLDSHHWHKPLREIPMENLHIIPKEESQVMIWDEEAAYTMFTDPELSALMNKVLAYDLAYKLHRTGHC